MSAPVFLAITNKGVVRAALNHANQWVIEPLVSDEYIRCLASDPLHPHIIYAGTQGGGVLRLDNDGKSWCPAGLSRQVVKALAVSPLEPGTVYAGTRPAALWVSRDGGTTWTEIESFRHIPGRRFWFSPAESPFSAYVQAIALSPTNPQNIVVGIEAGAVVQSTDGGKTWSGHRKGALRDCHSLTFHAANGDWAYEAGGTGQGASFSRDGGRIWTQPGAGLDRHYGWACAADPARPDIWYVSESPGPMKAHSDRDAQAYIFRSMDGGAWEKLGGGLPQPLDYMPYTLLTDPRAPGHLYAGLSSGDVWHSADCGDSWEKLPFNLGGIHRTLITLPAPAGV
jgi:hypothetical protein